MIIEFDIKKNFYDYLHFAIDEFKIAKCSDSTASWKKSAIFTGFLIESGFLLINEEVYHENVYLKNGHTIQFRTSFNKIKAKIKDENSKIPSHIKSDVLLEFAENIKNIRNNIVHTVGQFDTEEFEYKLLSTILLLNCFLWGCSGNLFDSYLKDNDFIINEINDSNIISEFSDFQTVYITKDNYTDIPDTGLAECLECGCANLLLLEESPSVTYPFFCLCPVCLSKIHFYSCTRCGEYLPENVFDICGDYDDDDVFLCEACSYTLYKD